MGIKNNEKEGGSAFPKAGHHQNGNGQVEGMSLRDYFAAKAMQGLATTFINMSLEQIETSIPIAASVSYALADAMLAERAKS